MATLQGKVAIITGASRGIGRALAAISPGSSGLKSYNRCRNCHLVRDPAQDREMSVDQSRKAVAERFGVSEQQVRHIEREGLEGNWPPLG